MLNREYLNSFICILKFRIKSLKKTILVPIILVDLLFPILWLYIFIKKNIPDEWIDTTKIFMFVIFPIASNYIGMFSMREYIEGEGNEIIYVYNRNCFILENFTFFFISLINIVIICTIFFLYLSALKLFTLWIIIICFFYFCLINFIYLLGNSIVLTIMVILIYTFINLMFRPNLEVAFFYSSALGYNLSKEFIIVYFPIFIMSIILFILSIYINHYRRRFK